MDIERIEQIAFNEGYRKGKEDAMKWIPCKERMPNAEDMHKAPKFRYLCFCTAYGYYKMCVCARLDGAVSPFWDWYGVPIRDSEVVAWMPLPKPYGERKESE